MPGGLLHRRRGGAAAPRGWCPAAGCTPVTAITPVVTVPVLSSTTVSTAREDSSAWYPLMKMPSCAPRPQATTSAAGVASPSAHGQAMISTASAALNARSAGLPASQPAGQRQRGRGQHQRDEHPADPVGEPLDARPSRACACSTRATRCASWVSLADLDRADDQPAAHHHRAGGDRVALGDLGRHRLPGHHAGVHRGLAELHLAVGGDRLPRPDHEPLARAAAAAAGTRRSVPSPSSTQASRAPAAASSRIASPASRRARASYHRPASRNVVTDAATSR